VKSQEIEDLLKEKRNLHDEISENILDYRQAIKRMIAKKRSLFKEIWSLQDDYIEAEMLRVYEEHDFSENNEVPF